MNLVSEQMDKIHGEYNGGFKYGHDYNILMAIIGYCYDKCLVKNLVKSLKDKVLRNKVKAWMRGSDENPEVQVYGDTIGAH